MPRSEVVTPEPCSLRIMRLGREPEKDEMLFYEQEALRDERQAGLRSRLTAVSRLQAPWANPVEPWLDNLYDSVPQAEVYGHLRVEVTGGDVLQLGGTGKEALKALLGGARRSYLVTPVPAEAHLTESLATEFGIGDRFTAIVGTGEEVPIPSDSIDAVISEGCMHHTDVPAALLEVRRVLRSGGRFGAWDPWHARLYDIGTSLFGKREPGIECRPLNLTRVATLVEVFPDSEIRLHGALTRYPVVALGKAGIRPSQATIHRMTLIDDRISARVPALRRNGSSVSVLATKK
jgi:SAM-dependent methyltransferase